MKQKVTTLVGLVLILVLLLTPALAYAAGGGLDTGFGTGGKVTTDVGNNNIDEVRDVALQPDGKIVVVGWTTVASSDDDVALVRYNVDGTLDTSFGNGGIVVTSLSAGMDRVDAVAIQPDGKIIVAGVTQMQALLLRYNSDGTLDTTFGTNGKVMVGSLMSFGAVALQWDGKIVAGGTAGTAFALARFCPNGHLDDGTAAPTGCGGSGFGTNGIVTTQIGSNTATGVSDLIIQPDGKIVAGGEATMSTSDFALVRYNSTGTLDSTFGTNGVVVTDFTGADMLYSLALQPDGAIVAVGRADVTLALARYTPDGSLDGTFGTGGKVTLFTIGVAEDVAIQPDGKIVVAGAATNSSGDEDFALMRFCPNGHLDDGTAAPTGCGGSGFGTGGMVTTGFGAGSSDHANALALQPDGMIVTAGYAASDVALARYDGGVAPNPGIVTAAVDLTVVEPLLDLFAHDIHFPTTLLNGSDLILDAFPSTWQARANMSNWHITIQSTDFSDGLGDFIPAAGFTVTMANSDIARVTGTAAPSSQVAASNVALDTPVTLISATGGAGIGVYNFTPHFTLLVPGSTVAGSYAATVTVTIASGP